MNTPSHLLLHWGIRKYLKDKKEISIPKSFVFWSIAPDIWLYFCVFLYIPISTYFFWNSLGYTFRHMFDTLYFYHPVWIFSYNVLHAPMMLFLFFLIIKIFQNNLGKHYRILLWFIVWCILHSVFDIPLHHDDGPRIFYPFSDYMFSSPISYWDRDYYANYVSPVEICLSLSILLYILFTPFKKIFLWKK